MTTRVGLFFTDADLAVMADRSVNGPYKSAGDVATNSAGDWDRIASEAATFKADNTHQEWTDIHTGAPPYQGGSNDREPNRTRSRSQTSAALYSIVKNDETYADPVRSRLLAYAGNSFIDWSDRDIFPYELGSPRYAIDDGPFFFMNAWMVKQLFSYDCIKDFDIWSAGEKDTLDDWFEACADWNRYQLFARFDNWHPSVVDWDNMVIIPSKRNSSSAGAANGENLWTNLNAPERNVIGGWYNNRSSCSALYVGLAGEFFDNATWRQYARAFVKNLIAYATGYEPGTYAEFHRNVVGNEEDGLDYFQLTLGNATMIAEVQARNGHPELYNHSSTEGLLASETEAPAFVGSDGVTEKSILTTYQGLARYFLENTEPGYYGREYSGVPIDGIDDASGDQVAGYWTAGMANRFYDDETLYNLYTRNTDEGYYGFSADTIPPNTEQGPWWTLPGIQFMTAQMEDEADPYDLTLDPPAVGIGAFEQMTYKDLSGNGTGSVVNRAKMSSAPAVGAFDITPNDIDDLPRIARALYIGTTGNVRILTPDDEDITFDNVPVGTLEAQAKRVFATSTTASDIVGLA